ncbi:hypothetical protein Cgig2_030409 [Carnegiea gigantea]|uniref:Uncharacterized protein n=1 Tax=Carnegiea gigantea TaxID=171969 RepID=A0A9Q1QLS5_9CARY|nr:hypothetical protein Cgig2_030409 [Carnegiea gigantea]
MLDPFIKLLTSYLSSKYEEVVSVSLECIFPLIRLPLPSLESQADKIKGKLLDIAQNSVNVDSPITHSCLKLLTALLRGTKITLSTDQLHVLVQFPLFIDLEKNPSLIALTLLMAIVRRKLMVHEIYDIVTQVAKLMGTSQEDAIRRKCSQILLQFLLNYQLKEKCRQQHLDFLARFFHTLTRHSKNNSKYEHATGREAVVEMLGTIIKSHRCLVVALANDHDNQVRSLIGIVIKHLISRISSQSQHSILEYCLAWYLGEKQRLWSTSAQVLGFVVEVMERGFQKHISNVLPVMRKIMKSSLTVLNDAQLNMLDQETIPFWKEAYYSLVLLEKILTQLPDLLIARDVEDTWQSISEFLMHPHPWICSISSRLVALYFEQMEKQGKKLGTTCLTSTSRLFLIASSFCCLVKAQFPDKGARGHVKRNLAYAICGIQSLLHQTDHKDPRTFWSSLNPREQGCFLQACRLLGTKEGRSIEATFTYGLDKFDQKDENDISCILVSGLLKVVGKTAFQTEDIQTRTIVSSLKLIAMQMSQEDCQKHAFQLLLPIYELCEGFSGKIVSVFVSSVIGKVVSKRCVGKLFGKGNAQKKSVERLKKLWAIRNSFKLTARSGIVSEKGDKRKREEVVMAVWSYQKCQEKIEDFCQTQSPQEKENHGNEDG